MKVLALDYGSARTGVAVSDPTGTLARPVCAVRAVGTQKGLAHLVKVIGEHEPERIVVGLPLTLKGELGAQAQETEQFVEALRAAVAVPVETYDERFTTALAARSGGAMGGARAGEDARAAAHLLESYLQWAAGRS